MTGRKNVTADELLAAGDIGPCELVRGEVLLMSPPGCRHGGVAAAIIAALRTFVQARHLGIVVADAGFILSHDPDTVRGPDVAFVRSARIPPAGPPEEFWDGPPDLAVEVVSPGDRWSEVEEKVRAYLAAGTSLVWVVDPRTRTAHVYRPAGAAALLSEEASLDGLDVIPDFALPLQHAFLTSRDAP